MRQNIVSVRSQFFPKVRCRFGGKINVAATYVNRTMLSCKSPPVRWIGQTLVEIYMGFWIRVQEQFKYIPRVT